MNVGGATPIASRVVDVLWYVAIAAVAIWALVGVVQYVGAELGFDEVLHVLLLTFYTLAARRRADGAGVDRVGADQRLDRLAAALGGSACSRSRSSSPRSRSTCCSARRSASC